MHEFLAKQWLLLIVALPIYWLWYTLWYQKRKIIIPLSLAPEKRNSISAAYIIPYLRFLPEFFFSIALLFMIGAMAEPVTLGKPIKQDFSGRLITLAIDLSASMETPDISPNRFQYALKLMKTIITNSGADLIGLVIFAQEAYQYIPPTGDKTALLRALNLLKIEPKFKEGTALGNAIAVAIQQQEKYTSRSKNIIALSDGVNNAGEFEPTSAAAFAQHKGSKVHAVAIGRKQLEQVIKNDSQIMQTAFDAELLEKMTAEGKGVFIEANQALPPQELLAPLFQELQKQPQDISYYLYYKTQEPLYPQYIAYASICFLLGALMQFVGFYNPLE
jgi:Ca-activated chloride channel family protein